MSPEEQVRAVALDVRDQLDRMEAILKVMPVVPSPALMVSEVRAVIVGMHLSLRLAALQLNLLSQGETVVDGQGETLNALIARNCNDALRLGKALTRVPHSMLH